MTHTEVDELVMHMSLADDGEVRFLIITTYEELRIRMVTMA